MSIMLHYLAISVFDLKTLKRPGDEFLGMGIGSYPSSSGDIIVFLLLRKENVPHWFEFVWEYLNELCLYDFSFEYDHDQFLFAS